jgi:hypothetical protein
MMYVIDGSSNTIMANVTMPENIYNSVINPAGTYIYACGASNTIYEVRVYDFAITRKLALPSGYNASLYINSDGTKIYATSKVADVYVINLNSMTIVNTWGTGSTGTSAIGYDAIDQWIIVGGNNNYLRAYNLSGGLVKSINAGAAIPSIAVNNQDVIVANTGVNYVNYYNISTGLLVAYKYVDAPTNIVRASSIDDTYFAVNGVIDGVTKLTTTKNTSLNYGTPRNITGILDPRYVASSIDGKYLYVGGGDANNYSVTLITVLNSTSYQFTNSISVYGVTYSITTGMVRSVALRAAGYSAHARPPAGRSDQRAR